MGVDLAVGAGERRNGARGSAAVMPIMPSQHDASDSRLVARIISAFWPGFVLHQGFLLRSDFSQQSLDGFLTQCTGDRQRVEAAMNHTHVEDMIRGIFRVGEDISCDQVDRVGEVLRDMWSTKLRSDFPGLPIEVTYDGDQITAFQIGETA